MPGQPPNDIFRRFYVPRRALCPKLCLKPSLKSASQQISVKYLEQIITGLSRAGLVKAGRGSQGGYRLTRKPCEYTAGEILRAMEGSLAPIPCLDGEENLCPNSGSCFTLPFWSGLGKVIDQYVDSITLEDLYQQTMNTPGAAL